MAKINNKPKPPECPFCKKKPCHPGFYEFFGTNEREDIAANVKRALKLKNMDDHIFYRKPSGASKSRGSRPQVHHLISVGAVEGDKWKTIFEAYGYNINCEQNGIILPSDMFVACHYRVPLHRGSHDYAFGDPDMTQLLVYKTYVDSVRKLIKDLKQACEKACDEDMKDKIKQFHRQMLDYSNKILENKLGKLFLIKICILHMFFLNVSNLYSRYKSL